jgi:hypothetical protein
VFIDSPVLSVLDFHLGSPLEKGLNNFKLFGYEQSKNRELGQTVKLQSPFIGYRKTGAKIGSDWLYSILSPTQTRFKSELGSYWLHIGSILAQF